MEKELENLIKELRELEQIREWDFLYGKFPDAYKLEFDIPWKQKVDWGLVIPEWEPSLDYGWFRKKIKIPLNFYGINLKHARLQGIFYCPLGGEIFVNGEKIEETDWLPDTVFEITENFGGEEFLVVIKTNKQKGWGRFFFSHIYIDKIDEVIFELELFLNLVKFTKAIPKWTPSFKDTSEKIVKGIERNFDYDALKNKNVPSLVNSINSLRPIFAPLRKEARKFTIHLIGHAHIDINWLWTWSQTLNTAKGTFETVDNLMRDFPEFRFSQSQSALYEAMENNFPQIFSKIRKRFKEKKWEITASTWVENDLNLPSGESLVRQILYGKKYIKEKFNFSPEIGWFPDSFGACFTLPQVLKKSGINFYYNRHGAPENAYPLFWWESPDGSKVLSFVHGETYNYQIRPSLLSNFINYKNRTGSNHYLISHGVGDHGGGPTRKDLERVRKLKAVKEFPNLKFDFSQRFFKEVLKEKKKLPIVKDELNFTFEGCYTTHADIKRFNRISENTLYTAEILNLFSTFYGGKYFKDKIESGWENTLFNQFHDILAGSAIHSSYNEEERHAKNLFNQTLSSAQEVINDSFKKIVQNINFEKEGIPIVVFNQCSWGREDLVKIKKENFPSSFNIYDEEGNSVPFQENDKEIAFVANIPSLGYRTYYLKPGLKEKEEGIYVKEENSSINIENTFFSLKISKETGCILSLFDKRVKKELIFRFKGNLRMEGKPYPLPANLFQIFYEKPNPMSAWVIGTITKIENILSEAKVKVKEKGPVMVVIEVKRKILQSSLTQDIIIYKEIPRIDFYTEVDWQEKGNAKEDAPMLKVAFPLNITSKESCFEIPFGYIYRANNGAEYPSLKWMDLSDEEKGVSILNDSKYGASVEGSTIHLTLLRSAYQPDPIADLGKHKFAYAIYPHQGSWKKGRTVQKAQEFNQPFVTIIVEKKNSLKKLPEKFSFLSVTPENLIISAIKNAEDDKGIILRLYESYGKKTKGEINLNIPVKEAIETDLMENNSKKKLKIIKGKIRLNVNKYEIKTIRLKRR